MPACPPFVSQDFRQVAPRQPLIEDAESQEPNRGNADQEKEADRMFDGKKANRRAAGCCTSSMSARRQVSARSAFGGLPGSESELIRRVNSRK